MNIADDLSFSEQMLKKWFESARDLWRLIRPAFDRGEIERKLEIC